MNKFRKLDSFLKNITNEVKILTLVTLFSLLLFFFSIIQSQRNELILSGLGLVSSLHPTFFISLILLTFVFLISDKEKNFLPTLQITILILMLFLTPFLLEGTPRFNSCYVIAGEIDFITRNGFLEPQIIRYHNWPLADIFGSIIVNVSNIELVNLLSFTPTLSQLAYLPFLFLLFRKLFGTTKSWFCCWLFYLVNWINQDYFSPQNLAFFFYILFMYFLLNIITHKQNQSQYRLLTVIILFAIVVTHVLTSIILIINLFVVFTFYLLFKNNTRAPNLTTLFSLTIVVLFAWSFIGADFMISKIIPNMLHSFGVDSTRDATISIISKGSLMHNLIAFIRIFSALLFGIIASIGFFYTFIYKKCVSLENLFMICFLLSGTASLFVGKYGGEIIIRVLLFSLISLTYFAIHNLNNRRLKVIILIFILISPFLHIIGHYGNETIDYTSPNEISGAFFFFNKAKFNSTIICPQNNLCDILYVEKFPRLYDYDYKNSFNNNSYIWLTRRGEQKYYFFEESSEILLFNQFKEYITELNKIYSNEHMMIYK